MIKAYWFSYLDADCAAFNVYRAVTGLVIPFPNTLTGNDVLILSATSPDVQKISFGAVDADSIVGQINAVGKGIVAKKSVDGTKVFVRCTAPQKGRMKLYASSFLTKISQNPRIIVPALEFQRVAAVTRLDGTFSYSYEDLDGSPLDFYYITSSASAESIPSVTTRPMIPLSLMCVIEGRATDAQNNSAEGCEVIAQLRLLESHDENQSMIQSEVHTKTDAQGRFTLPLVRCQQYLLQIPALGYNETIILPDQDTANLLQLAPTLAGRFSPFGDPQ